MFISLMGILVTLEYFPFVVLVLISFFFCVELMLQIFPFIFPVPPQDDCTDSQCFFWDMMVIPLVTHCLIFDYSCCTKSRRL